MYYKKLGMFIIRNWGCFSKIGSAKSLVFFMLNKSVTSKFWNTLTLFKILAILFLKRVRCVIIVDYRLRLRTYFARFTPELGADILVTSVGERRMSLFSRISGCLFMPLPDLMKKEIDLKFGTHPQLNHVSKYFFKQNCRVTVIFAYLLDCLFFITWK